MSPPEIYTLSLHDALPIWAAGVPEDVAFATKPVQALAMLRQARAAGHLQARWVTGDAVYGGNPGFRDALDGDGLRSEEHTSELQSLRHIVCRLLLETKNYT